MSKSFDELAQELTIAWIHAMGQAAAGIGGAHAVTGANTVQKMTAEEIARFYDQMVKQIRATAKS